MAFDTLRESIAIVDVDRTPLRVQVSRELQRLLRVGFFRPGTRITEMAVADALSVSRTPAREALSLLGESGVLQPLPGGGFIVPKPTAREIDELYQMRALLELPALRAAIGNRTAKTVKSLAACLQTLRDSQENLASVDFIDAFLRFRETLFRGCGNELLERSIHGLDNQTESMKALALAAPEIRTRIVATYSALLAAFEIGDVDQSVAVLSEHHRYGRNAYAAVARDLEQRPSSQPSVEKGK